MKILVTGSSGHLGEALMRVLQTTEHEAVGLDLLPGQFTLRVGDIADRDFVKESMKDIEVVMHTATLHKPHVETHSRQRFLDVNVTGTLNLLEEAVEHNVKSFIFTSTTSLFGDAMKPSPGGPAVYITEDVVPKPKNIYGVTKIAAENLCQLMNRVYGLPCIVLRTSRFFPEPDDQDSKREAFDDTNLKTIEYLYRRVDIADIVDAHLLAMEKAPGVGYGCYIISATTPFTKDHLDELGTDGPAVVQRLFPDSFAIFEKMNWKMLEAFDRVYSNARARDVLGWKPKYDFRYHLDRLSRGEDPRSELAQSITPKGYHEGHTYGDIPFPARQES